MNNQPVKRRRESHSEVEELSSKSAGTKPYRTITYIITSTGCRECDSHKPSHFGYPRIRRNKQLIPIHRYIFEKHHRKLKEGEIVMHLCDNRKCINPEHLQAGTIADNNQDMRDKKRHCKGEDSPFAKLTTDDVLYIRSHRDVHRNILAEKFGVNNRHINAIWKGTTWRHLLTEVQLNE